MLPPLRSLWRRIDQLAIRGLPLDSARRFPTTNAWLSEIEEIFLQLKLTRVNRNKARPVLGSYVDWFRAKFGNRNR